MTHLEWSDTLGRLIRKDDWEQLGVPTQEKLKEAIAAGRTDEALALVDYLVGGVRSMHNVLTDWVWALLTWVAREYGEDEAGRALIDSTAAWARPRYGTTYEIPRNLSVEERVQQTVEAMHTHLPFNPNGKPVEIVEEEDRFVLRFDPCGSGGRMRRGDPSDGTGARTDPPYNFLTTRQPHDWSWGKTGVCLYCAHCALVNEIWAIDAMGFPFRVTNPPDDPDQPCVWHIYKRPEDVPAEVYERVGRRKPARFPPPARTGGSAPSEPAQPAG